MDKSYVSMEQKICPVCGDKHDTDSILMDTRLHNRFERYTVTGYGHCKDCQTKIDEGYVAFIEASNTPVKGETMGISEAVRTGRCVWVRQTVCDEMLDVKITKPMVFVEPAVVEHLRRLAGEE